MQSIHFRTSPAARHPAALAVALAAALGASAVSCGDSTDPSPESIEAGREIFRFDTFGDEKFWTETCNARVSDCQARSRS